MHFKVFFSRPSMTPHGPLPVGDLCPHLIQAHIQTNHATMVTSYRSGGGKTICRLAADLCPSAGQLQAASMPITQAAVPCSQRAIA